MSTRNRFRQAHDQLVAEDLNSLREVFDMGSAWVTENSSSQAELDEGSAHLQVLLWILEPEIAESNQDAPR